MTYQPKIIRCRLNMACKTIPEIRERYAGQGLTYRDFENIQRANEQFDGLILPLTLWEYDDYSAYHLFTWDTADDERMMMALYYSEQTHPYPRYKDALDAFKAAWAAGEYDSGGCVIVFDPWDVEEIEVISEEVKPEQAAPPSPPAPRKQGKKKKKGRKRK